MLSPVQNRSPEDILQHINSVPYWFHQIEIAPGIITPGEETSPAKLIKLQLPENMQGKRVLDLGTHDGFFAFECEQRGAEVVAIDTLLPGQSGLKIAHMLLNSKTTIYTTHAYDLNPEILGSFDIVLCIGLFPHLRHPLLAFERIHAVCHGIFILETQICDRYFIGPDNTIIDFVAEAPVIAKQPLVQFYPGAELNGDPSNWWSPTIAGLEAMLLTSGFEPFKIIQDGVRVCIHSQWFPIDKTNICLTENMGMIQIHEEPSQPQELESNEQAIIAPTLTTEAGNFQNNQPLVDEIVQSYEQSFRQAIDDGSSIYEPMTPIIQAAHERRMELLDQLPIGEVSQKICVDYGVGSWGFACIYPRLQHCAQAIGIDISEVAVQESESLSAQGNFPYGKNYRYFTARGDQIDLETNSVDIFFAGECIEHVENTHAFLDQIHRILKPQGILILTTPNADAYIFKSQNERYAVGPEHVALMSYPELCSYLAPRFTIIEAHGFNGSLHPIFDNQIIDADFATSWAAQFRDQPELGTGLVIMAQRNDHYSTHSYQQQIYHHSNPIIDYYGNWSKINIHKAMTAHSSASVDDKIHLHFMGNGIILNLWMHDWSGIAEIRIDDQSKFVNLYSPRGGFERLVFHDLPSTPHELEIRVTGEKDPRSYSHEVIFYQAISYIYS